MDLDSFYQQQYIYRRLEITHSVALNLEKPRANRTDAEYKLRQLSASDARIIILYATQRQAEVIFEIARDFQMTGIGYLWLATQSVIGSNGLVSWCFIEIHAYRTPCPTSSKRECWRFILKRNHTH
jgi:hypothetical protein